MRSGPKKDLGQNGGTRTCTLPTLAVYTVDKSVQELKASLALTACLTSRFFNFRWKIRQELTKLETLVIEGSTNLQKGLEKVRRARTTYGLWLRVDCHGGHLTPESPSFLYFLAG